MNFTLGRTLNLTSVINEVCPTYVLSGFYNYPFKVIKDINEHMSYITDGYVMASLTEQQEVYESYLLKAGFKRVSGIVNPNSDNVVFFYIVHSSDYKPLTPTEEEKNVYDSAVEEIKQKYIKVYGRVPDWLSVR